MAGPLRQLAIGTAVVLGAYALADAATARLADSSADALEPSPGEIRAGTDDLRTFDASAPVDAPSPSVLDAPSPALPAEPIAVPAAQPIALPPAPAPELPPVPAVAERTEPGPCDAQLRITGAVYVPQGSGESTVALSGPDVRDDRPRRVGMQVGGKTILAIYPYAVLLSDEQGTPCWVAMWSEHSRELVREERQALARSAARARRATARERAAARRAARPKKAKR